MSLPEFRVKYVIKNWAAFSWFFPNMEKSICVLNEIHWKIWNTLILKKLKSTFLKQHKPIKMINDLNSIL